MKTGSRRCRRRYVARRRTATPTLQALATQHWLAGATSWHWCGLVVLVHPINPAPPTQLECTRLPGLADTNYVAVVNSMVPGSVVEGARGGSRPHEHDVFRLLHCAVCGSLVGCRRGNAALHLCANNVLVVTCALIAASFVPELVVHLGVCAPRDTADCVDHHNASKPCVLHILRHTDPQWTWIKPLIPTRDQ